MQVLHYLPAGVPVNAAACLWAAEQGAGGWRWQDFALMRSWAAICGNFLASCIPEGASDGKSVPPWQHIAAVYPKRAGVGKICAPCIRKAPQIAVGGCITRISCQEGALFAALAPRIMHTAQILPSVAVEQRERSQARRRPYGAAEQGASGFLSGGGAAEGVRGVVGCRALTEKPASAKRRLWVSDADRLAESRKPAFAGRAQGGAAARRRRSSGPAERGLLAVRAKGCFGSAQAMPPTSMTRRSRARNSQRSAR